MSLPKSYTSSVHGSDMPDDQLADYKAVFPTEVAKFPYDKHKVARVAKNRAALGGQLFFDKLCAENLDRVDNSKMLHSGYGQTSGADLESGGGASSTGYIPTKSNIVPTPFL